MTETVAIPLTDEQQAALRRRRDDGDAWPFGPFGEVLDALADALPATKPDIKPWHWYRHEAGHRVLLCDVYDKCQILFTVITGDGLVICDHAHVDDASEWELIGPCEVPT